MEAFGGLNLNGERVDAVDGLPMTLCADRVLVLNSSQHGCLQVCRRAVQKETVGRPSFSPPCEVRASFWLCRWYVF